MEPVAPQGANREHLAHNHGWTRRRMTTKAPQETPNAVIVGAGIVGVCCSYALQRVGFNVTLIDKDEPGRAASYGNSGSIGLSSSPPLGTPGMLKDVPRILLDPMRAAGWVPDRRHWTPCP